MVERFVPLADLGRKDRLLLLIHYVIILIAGLLFLPTLWGQAPQPSGREMVDALHSAFGDHHARAVHAKGVIVSGTFTPSQEAARYTTAAHLQSSVGTLPVIARFSDFTGIPDIPDADPRGSPKGFAARIILPDGQTTDIVNHSFNGFPVSNASDFATLLRAIGKASSTPADATDLQSFLSSHPSAKSFLTSQKPAPVSWATTPYFGVNAFRFTNAQGSARYIRYRFVPMAGEAYISKEQESILPHDYLSEEIGERLRKGPVQFRMQAQIAEPDDDFRDPSTAWPSSRRVIDLGLLTFTKVVPGEDASRNLQFEPGSVIAGIEIADPMLSVRKTAYPVSVSERQ